MAELEKVKVEERERLACEKAEAEEHARLERERAEAEDRELRERQEAVGRAEREERERRRLEALRLAEESSMVESPLETVDEDSFGVDGELSLPE